jgi:hypothetical protein
MPSKMSVVMVTMLLKLLSNPVTSQLILQQNKLVRLFL